MKAAVFALRIGRWAFGVFFFVRFLTFATANPRTRAGRQSIGGSDLYGSQGANFTAGVREREDPRRTREAGAAVWETEHLTSSFCIDVEPPAQFTRRGGRKLAELSVERFLRFLPLC